MAEFCLDCWNKITHSNDTQRDFILSRKLDLCEGCGQWKHVIITERKCKFLYDLTHIRKQTRR